MDMAVSGCGQAVAPIPNHVQDMAAKTDPLPVMRSRRLST
jgi:hypothetical protein